MVSARRLPVELEQSRMFQYRPKPSRRCSSKCCGKDAPLLKTRDEAAAGERHHLLQRILKPSYHHKIRPRLRGRHEVIADHETRAGLRLGLVGGEFLLPVVDTE